MNPTQARPPGGIALIVQVAISGSVRTRRDAEDMRNKILRAGYEKEDDCANLYRALLAILGDMSALNVPEPQFSNTQKFYRLLKKHYIADSECRCLRNATGGVMTMLTSCPVHGDKPGARAGLRNLLGLKR